MHTREQACWLALVFESKLPIRTVNDILVIWCKELKRSLEEFFASDTQVWHTTCHLGAEAIGKLQQAKEKLVGQAFLVEQLQHEHISMLTILDASYPTLLKKALGRNQIPPVLFYSGDLTILQRQTIAIIGSRNANETSLAFTRALAKHLTDHEVNVISGYARGVDRVAYEGATSAEGYTTVVLPHGIHKLSKVQMRELQPRIEAGHVLLLSQFHPDAPWLASRAMERNNVVTGLAQLVIVAESDSKGGTWDGADRALKLGRTLYVRQTQPGTSLPGNDLLLKKGGLPLPWPVENLTTTFSSLLDAGDIARQQQNGIPIPPQQLPLMASQER